MVNNNFFNTNFFEMQKKITAGNLRKTANGLGFFVLTYTLLMNLNAVFLITAAMLFGYSTDDFSKPGATMYLFDIFVSVFAAFISSLLYLFFSGKNIVDIVKVKRVKTGWLFHAVCIGLAVAMIANYLNSILQQNFSFFGVKTTIDFNNSSSTPFENILYVIAVAVMPAFAEEFAFRGVLMGSLRKYGDSFAILVSAIMFGCMHGNITQIPFAFVLGLYLAYVDCKANSIVPSIIIHFINNFYAVILDIINHETNMSDTTSTAIQLILMVAFCILGIISFIYFTKKHKDFFKLNEYAEPDSIGSILTLKEKNKAFFLNAGVIISLSFFAVEMICTTNLFSQL